MKGEKRDNTRLNAVTEVSYEYRGVAAHGRVSDLSSGGFYIDTINPLPEGSIINFHLVLPGDDPAKPLAGEARVAWSKPLQGMGIRFTRISEDDRKRLESFISQK